MQAVRPVILSGGSGTRMWPLSRSTLPKQFHALTGTTTLFQATLARLEGFPAALPAYVVANRSHRELVVGQAAAMPTLPGAVILEPSARNTAPAIALAALLQAEEDPSVPLLVMPSDHIIARVDAFHAAIAGLLPQVIAGRLATFGILPDRPETGFGYIRGGETLGEGVLDVQGFIEKPDAEKATALIAAGDCYWNAGIFLFRADRYLEELETHQPAMLAAAKAALAGAQRDGAVILPDADAFAASPSDSIDYAVMEQSKTLAVAPVDLGWSDIGSWDALADFGDADDKGNVITGNVLAIDTHGCMIRSTGPVVSTIGLKDILIVATEDAVLILPKGQSQDVKKMVDLVKAHHGKLA